jgi:rhamnose transport system permease protein
MNWLQRRVRPEQIRELSLLVLIVVAIAFFGSFIDGYYSFRTFNRIASSVAIITVVAVGQTLVVLTRNIDLSVGSIVGFTAYFVGTLIAAHNSINPLLAVAIAIALGAALGVVNGLIVAWGRVPAVVVTLGTLAIYRGVLVDLSGAKTVTTDSLPDWLTGLPLVNVAPIGNLDIRHDLSELRQAILRNRLQPRGGAARRPAYEGRRLRCIRHLRGAGGSRRLHVSRSVRQHHRRSRTRAGT